MARPLRLFLPYTQHYIVHRGHYRQNVFVAADDYWYYLANGIHFKRICMLSTADYLLAGSDKFRQEVSNVFGIRIASKEPGRPKTVCK